MRQTTGSDDDDTTELPVVGRAIVSEPAVTPPDLETIGTQPRAPSFLLIIGLITAGVVLVAIGVLAGFSLSRSGPTATGVSPSPTIQRDSPSVVTERYLSAVIAGDQVAANADTCRLLRTGGSPNSASEQHDLQLGGFVHVKPVAESVDGRRASVDVELGLPIVGSIGFLIRLVLEDGAWRVCGGGPR